MVINIYLHVCYDCGKIYGCKSADSFIKSCELTCKGKCEVREMTDKGMIMVDANNYCDAHFFEHMQDVQTLVGINQDMMPCA